MAHWQSNDISSRYAAYRPEYPQELIDMIVAEVDAAKQPKEVLLDLGSGTGQAFIPLAPQFHIAVANDISDTQIEACRKAVGARLSKEVLEHCHFAVGTAESFTLPTGVDGVDLITIAQAMHWFDMDVFAKELQRKVKPGGFVASWLYETARLDPAPCDEILSQFDKMLMRDGHWPEQRKFIDSGYRELVPQLPFPLIRRIEMNPVEEKTLDNFMAYLSTWSGVNRYVASTGHKTILEELRAKFAEHLDDGKKPLRVTLPIRAFIFRRPL
jgi:SAM-dependent methyltransferase